MARVVDVLVTKYQLDDSGYEAGAKRVVSASGQIGAGLGTVVNALAGISAATIGATVAIGAHAISMAADFERMSATIGGALGGLDKGVEVMKSLETYAMKSAFQLNDLAEATTQMVAAGLNIRTLLPVAERFALVIGGTNPEGLQMVVRALTLAKGGAFGESMETLRRAGVGRGDFEKQGIKVSAGGQIQSTPEEFVNAIIRISEGRPKQMADAVGETSAVKISNAKDALESAFRSLGTSLLTEAIPIVQTFTSTLGDLTKGGYFKEIGGQLVSFMTDLQSVLGMGGEGGLQGTVINLIAGFQTGFQMMQAATLGFIQGMKNVITGIGHVLNFVFDALPGGRYLRSRLGVDFTNIGGMTGLTDMFEANKASIQASIEIGRRNAKKSKGDDLPDTGDKSSSKPATKIPMVLDRIERNTRISAQADMRRMAFGAANSDYGVSAVQLSARGSRKGSVNYTDLASMLQSAVQHEAARMVKEAMRGARA